MLEDNQSQPWLQPEIQVNPQIQQNNLVQSQQTNQEVVQQNNVESAEQDLSQNSKPHKSWLNKVLGWIFIFLWLILNGFWIYAIYYQISDWYPIWDIITDSLVWPTLLVWICFIIIWIRNISWMKFLFWIKNLFLSQKTHSSWLVKIVSLLFLLLWIGLIWLWIYWIFETQSDWHYSDYTIRDIIKYSFIWIFGPLWIWFIALWILSYRTQNVDVYYHPTRLTKILSGIYRFLWIALIRAGLWNFSLIWTENLSFLIILYVWWVISLCGILYIFLWRLLYNTKNKMHLWFSMLCALVVNIIFARILREFTDYSYWIDEDIFESFWVILVLFTLIYFSILTIRWIIKCRKFHKKWIINPKYLNQTPSKKKVWIITTIVLLSLVIIDLIYGKIQWSKIPEIDESIFAREEHQTKLPDEEDALIQLKNIYGSWYTNDVWDVLDIISLSKDNDSEINRKNHTDECFVIYSWWKNYCGTRAKDKKTLHRLLNSYYTTEVDSYKKRENYFIIDWKKVTILKYLDKKEPEIRADLQKLDGILSLDYNLNFPSHRDEPFYLLPQYLQWYARANMILLQYYTLKEDWDMVMFIIKLEYKMVDLFNHYWGDVPHLISFVIQNVTDSTISELISAFPDDFRIQLSERYSNLDYNKEWMLKERTKWEYNNTWKNRAKDVIFTDVWSDIPSLTQFLFHFPFLSKKDSNRFMEYAYYNLMYDEWFDFDSVQLILPKRSLYNYYGSYPYQALRPRVGSYNKRLGNTIYHKEALIKNLKSGKYDVRFSEKDWELAAYEYESNRILTDEELFENKIKEYSDIINPCFWREVLDPDYPHYYNNNFWDRCAQSLLELTNQDDDEFWLNGILIKITQSYIDYNEISAKMEDCQSQNVCKNVFDESDKIIKKLKNQYKKLIEILGNIKNKIPEINLDDYFYIPEVMIYKKN